MDIDVLHRKITDVLAAKDDLLKIRDDIVPILPELSTLITDFKKLKEEVEPMLAEWREFKAAREDMQARTANDQGTGAGSFKPVDDAPLTERQAHDDAALKAKGEEAEARAAAEHKASMSDHHPELAAKHHAHPLDGLTAEQLMERLAAIRENKAKETSAEQERGAPEQGSGD
jgi:hypothetical protein